MAKHTRRTFIRGSALSLALATPAGSALAAVVQPKGFRLGVNLAGAEFKDIGGRWKWPALDNLAYYLGKGFNVYRVPFKWRRLQPQLSGPSMKPPLPGWIRSLPPPLQRVPSSCSMHTTMAAVTTR